MDFKQLVEKLNSRIADRREREKAIKERFQCLKPLMDEDIELISKAFAASLEFPRHKETRVLFDGTLIHPRKFVYGGTYAGNDIVVDAMGIARFNRASITHLAVNAGKGRKGVIFYSMGEPTLLWKTGSLDVMRNSGIEVVDDLNVIEHFCDKFEEMHKDLREWLEKELKD